MSGHDELIRAGAPELPEGYYYQVKIKEDPLVVYVQIYRDVYFLGFKYRKVATQDWMAVSFFYPKPGEKELVAMCEAARNKLMDTRPSINF